MTTHHRPFFDLHVRGLVLPNAWDAASACIFQEAGFPAVGTTSAGIAYRRGRQAGQSLSAAEMLAEVAEIIAAVHIPVNADLEAGYGDSPEEVAATVRAFAQLGVVGVNLEDATGRPEAPLYPLEVQVQRLRAAREAAPGVFLNARTDTYLCGFGRHDEERLVETIRRGRAYREAGADSIFIPPITEATLIRRLREEIGAPITVMASPGAPRTADLLQAGACRVSIGQGAMLAALGLTAQIAQELVQRGTYEAMAATFYGFGQAEALFAR